MSFNLDMFIENCLSALKSENPSRQISELVAEAVSDPASLMEDIGKPERAEVQKLYVSDELLSQM